MKNTILKAITIIFKNIPLGDCSSSKNCKNGLISCCVVTKGKLKCLRNILGDLKRQILECLDYEIIVLNNGPDDQIRMLCEEIRRQGVEVSCYHESDIKTAVGALRNKSVERSSGEIILFLDDDTRLEDDRFLSKAFNIYSQAKPDVIIPQAFAETIHADFKNKYLDPFSFAARCIFYKKEFFLKLKGFHSFLNGYEDIDLGIRSVLARGEIVKIKELRYLHPPLFFYSMDKPFCIGQSVWNLKRKTPFFLWLMIYINSLRFLFYIFLPTQKNRQWFKISLGCLIGPWKKQKYCY